MRYYTRAQKRENAKAILNIAVTAIIVIVAIDFIGFIAWAMSGQQPEGSFYIGSMTTHIIRAII